MLEFDLSCIIGKDYISFSWKYDLASRRKMKDDLSKKKYTEIWYLLQMFWKDGLFKKDCAGTWSFLYYLERWYFFSRKHGIFSLDGKRVWVDLSHEIPWNMMFSIWYVPRFSAKKKLKTILFRKNAPKGDWHSRSTPPKELQQPSAPSWRPLQTFSYIALQQKKPRNLIYSI